MGKAIERKRLADFDYQAVSPELAPQGGKRQAELPAREVISAARVAEQHRALNQNLPERESAHERRNRAGFEEREPRPAGGAPQRSGDGRPAPARSGAPAQPATRPAGVNGMRPATRAGGNVPHRNKFRRRTTAR